MCECILILISYPMPQVQLDRIDYSSEKKVFNFSLKFAFLIKNSDSYYRANKPSTSISSTCIYKNLISILIRKCKFIDMTQPFPDSPPAHINEFWSSWKFDPNLVVLNAFWQSELFINGIFTSFRMVWYFSEEKCESPQPVVQHRWL